MTKKQTGSSILATTIALGALVAVALAPAPAMAEHGGCGQPQSKGPKPAAVDALVVLRSAVGSGNCGDDANECECDVDASGAITPRDSLVVLRSAVGLAAKLACAHDCETPGTTIPGVTSTTIGNDDDDDDGDGNHSTSTTIEDDDGDGSTSTTLQGGDDNDDQGDDHGDDGQGDDDGPDDDGGEID